MKHDLPIRIIGTLTALACSPDRHTDAAGTPNNSESVQA